MTDEFFNILIIILILLGCTYFYFNTIQMDTTPLREGLDLMGGSGSKTKSKSKSNSIYPTSSSSGSTENERDGASKYVDKLTHEVTKMKTGLNIATYRTDYENVLIQLNDYIGYAMLKTALDVQINLDDPSSAVSAFTNLNQLNATSTTLNSLMTWLDNEK